MDTKFPNDTSLNTNFEQIKAIRFFPYIGKDFISNTKKILVMAHNMYVSPETYASEQARTSSKTHFADALEEFTYEKTKYSKTFRSFVKGSLSINENFSKYSSQTVINEVDNFVGRIAYTNYVNDLVPSIGKTNITVDETLLYSSHQINKQLIKILNPTHIVCWGKNVFYYFLSQPEIQVVIKPWQNFKEKVGLENRQGFEYAMIKFNDKSIHILKTYHPSMPRFGHFNKATQNILSWFYSL